MADDIVILGGQTFPLTGFARSAGRSEFEVGLKVGKASYDNREDAFFLVLNDFTGGFGAKHLDIREELGTYWFADPLNAPETAFAGRVTLPLQQHYISIPQPPPFFDKEANVGYPAIEWSSGYIFMLGSSIYTLSELGGTPVRRYGNTNTHGISIISAVDPTAGNARLYASFQNGGSTGAPLMSLNDGASWSATHSRYVSNSLPILSGVTGDVIAEDNVFSFVTGHQLVAGGLKGSVFMCGDLPDPCAVPPEIIVDPSSSVQFFNEHVLDVISSVKYEADLPPFASPSAAHSISSAFVPVEDLFFWDHKVLGQWSNTKISFLVPGDGDGLILVNTPRGSYITGAEYVQIGTYKTAESVVTGTTVTGLSVSEDADGDKQATELFTDYVIPTYGVQKAWIANSHITYADDNKTFIQKGQEPWNHLVKGDEQIVAALDIARELRFIGVAPASWGEPAVFLRGGSKLYVLDFFSRKIYPVDMGANMPLIQARIWQGDIVATDGWDVFAYNTGQGTSRNIGFPRKWGISPNLLNGAVAYQIIDLIPNDDELLALAIDTEEPASILFRYNGVGWHQMGAKMPDFFAQYGFRVTFPLPGAGLYENREQAVIIPGVNGAGDAYGYWQFDLPGVAHQPTVGLDTFAASGARMYTGWIDGGFFDMDGTLLRMNVDAFFHQASQKIMVEYRLNNDPANEEDAVWTQMVDLDGNPTFFSSSTNAMYFSHEEHTHAISETGHVKAGIAFRTVQFRITLIRGSEADSSPELRALTLVYLKAPELRTTWTFNIDVNRMLERRQIENAYYVDDEIATVENVWAKLQELWTNEHTLVPLKIPNVMGDRTLYVKIVEMPLTFVDFRNVSTNRGTVTLTVLEPIA